MKKKEEQSRDGRKRGESRKSIEKILFLNDNCEYKGINKSLR